MAAERAAAASASARPPERGSADAGGHAHAGEPGAVVHEHHAVVARDGEEVGVGVEGPGPGDEPRARDGRSAHQPGFVRVAVISWEMPVDSRVRSTCTKPASARRGEHLVGLGQVGHRLGQVAVGARVGEQPADHGHDLAEVDAVAPAQHRVRRLGDLEDGDAAARAHDPAQLGEEARRARPGSGGRSRR